VKKLILLALIPMMGCLDSGGGSSPAPTARTETPAPTQPVVDPITQQPIVQPPGAPAAPVVVPTPTPIVQTPAGPTVATVAVTLYQAARTEAPVNGWPTKTYTAQATCFQYLSKIYCADDGVKTVTIPGLGPFTYTYFGIMTSGASFGICSGGCTNSHFLSMRLLTSSLMIAIGTQVNQILNSGAATQISCSDDGATLSCPGFQVAL
jgi:hypothetical protein